MPKAVITSRPRFVEAWVETRNGGGGGETLVILHSPLVDPTDSLFEPVNAYIIDKCLILGDYEEIDDPDFAFGRVRVRTYHVLEGCNGIDGHLCAKERVEQPICLNIDQSVR